MYRDPERARAYGKAWYAAHAEEQRARRRAWYAAHAEEERVYHRAENAKRPPVVYAWFAPDGQADWVGRGTVPRSKAHRRQSPWWTPQHLLISMTCDDEWQAMEYEGKWGGLYRPRYNKEGYRHSQSDLDTRDTKEVG